MKKIFNKIKNFFEDLRQKPESERQKWLWIFVSVSLLIVIVFWFFLLKKDMQVVDSTLSPTPTPTMAASSDSGFVHIFKVGWEKTSTFVIEKCKAIGGAIGNFLAGAFSYLFQGWKKVSHTFNDVNYYLEREFASYFKALGSLVSGDL
jgi:hypothetical protein